MPTRTGPRVDRGLGNLVRGSRRRPGTGGGNLVRGAETDPRRVSKDLQRTDPKRIRVDHRKVDTRRRRLPGKTGSSNILATEGRAGLDGQIPP